MGYGHPEPCGVSGERCALGLTGGAGGWRRSAVTPEPAEPQGRAIMGFT